ncbi:unnamed protein product [Toxocara canis]|uniref:Secreted protein n=1 Tax=Toxocara canis TaxID=6265 RepID=A0A183U8L5_TOXCA|nr:unnamed protein product [Toxocara canis]
MSCVFEKRLFASLGVLIGRYAKHELQAFARAQMLRANHTTMRSSRSYNKINYSSGNWTRLSVEKSLQLLFFFLVVLPHNSSIRANIIFISLFSCLLFTHVLFVHSFP